MLSKLLLVIYCIQTKIELEPPLILAFFTILMALGVLFIFLFLFFFFIERAYGFFYSKPFFVHFHLFKKQLPQGQRYILEKNFSFYQSLSISHKRIFEHRTRRFIDNKKFRGRDMVITNEIKVLTAATAIMLTFGFRKYLIKTIDSIIVYPEEYYSSINKDYHKGEFNPMLGALVLSWKDFIEGYRDGNDNINLGVHEMMHAIHLNHQKSNSISAFIFKKKYSELTNYLSLNEVVRQDLIKSDYFRDYAFTNQYEFLAVLVENFMETPNEFKRQFPMIYNKIKEMLNFRFSGF